MTQRTEAGRVPYEGIRLYLDRCQLNYGESPCTAAGGPKCFNTLATCQDEENYDPSEHEYRFTKNQERQPLHVGYVVPSLVSVSVKSPSINPMGGDKNRKAFGTFGSLSATFTDHVDTDRSTDPYVSERDYDPTKKGTYWTKWRARNAFYLGRRIVYEQGWLLPNGQIEAETLITRTYFIKSVTPVNSSGQVSIQASDPLSYMLTEKSKAPGESKGALVGSLTTGATSATLTTDEGYPASGYIRIGDEVIGFTRSGTSLTITRGEFNTLPSEHESGSTAQLCAYFDGMEPIAILQEVLEDYAGIDSQYLDLPQWAAEADGRIDQPYTAIITEPEGVQELVGEMMESMHFYGWWDDRSAKVKIKALRARDDEDATDLSDDLDLIADSVEMGAGERSIYSACAIYYGQINPTEDVDEAKNYRAVEVVIDPEQQKPERYGKDVRTKVIYSRWIPIGSAGLANEAATVFVARYGRINKRASFKLDARRADLNVADFVNITTRLNTNAEGEKTPIPMQLMGMDFENGGSKINCTADEFTFVPIRDLGETQLIVAVDLVDVNMRTWFESQTGREPVSGDVVHLIVRPGKGISNTLQRDSANNDGNRLIQGNNIAWRRLGSSLSNALFESGAGRRFPLLARQGASGVTTYNPSTNLTSADIYPGKGRVLSTVRECPPGVALRTGTWPAGVELRITIEPGGYISGLGGAGGYAMTATNWESWGATKLFNTSDAIPAGDGSDGLLIEHAVTIDNQGTIQRGNGGRGHSRFLRSPTVQKSWDVSTAGGAGRGGTPSGFGTDPVTSDLFSNIRGWGGATHRVIRWNGTGEDVNQAPTQSASRGSVTNAGQNSVAVNAWGSEWPIRSFGFLYLVDRVYGDTIRYKDSSGFSAIDPNQPEYLYDSTDSDGQHGKAIRSGSNLVTWINKGTVIGAED